jgi:hypothetical protein
VEAVPASEPITGQLRVEEGFPLLMLSRTIYNAELGKPIVFSQDFLRSDYARIHSEVVLDEITPSTDFIIEGKGGAYLTRTGS